MPNRDRTGPEGKGPRTGRQLGDCKESDTEDEKPIVRRGLGRGRNSGRGRGRQNV